MSILTKVVIAVVTAFLVISISFIVALFLTDIVLRHIHKK